MIRISDDILTKVSFNVGVVELSCSVGNSEKLDKEIDIIEEEINNKYDIKDVIKIPNILDARNAYKTFGKDPSRYRLACESLYRRLAKGNKLYRINNAVDIGNLLSIKTQKSVAVLDRDNIKGDILIRLGNQSDSYHGIGRGKLNIDRIPLYEDELGPFGSTTSDTERTMIKESTKNILVFIISFSGKDQLYEDIDLCKKLFIDYADAVIKSTNII